VNFKDAKCAEKAYKAIKESRLITVSECKRTVTPRVKVFIKDLEKSVTME